MADILKNMHWIHHSSFRIETAGGKIIYIDPWKVKNPVKADYIFITHEHFDHFSLNDIDEIIQPGTVIICPIEVAKELKGYEHVKLRAGEKYESPDLKAEAVPAYNLGKNFHSVESGKLGYVIEIDGEKLYHAGDTDFVVELKELSGINVALVPVGGTYTMNPEEAAQLVNTIKPEVAVPMHYNEIVGTRKEAEDFKKMAKCRVEILKEEE